MSPKPGGVYVDATLGGGGHAEAILERIIPGGRLIGIDRDDDATAEASRRLQRFGEAAVIVRENFTAIKEVLHSLGLSQVDGILFDLGASSMQFENADRGFSFAAAGPLDMRMDRRQPVTAAEIVNRRPEEELAGLIWRYGEERWSRRIARAIVRARPLSTTTALAEVVAGARTLKTPYQMRRRLSGRQVDSAPLPSTPWRIERSNTPSCASPVGAPRHPGPPPAVLRRDGGYEFSPGNRSRRLPKRSHEIRAHEAPSCAQQNESTRWSSRL